MVNHEIHTVVYDPITAELQELIDQLHYQILSSDSMAVVTWHSSLTNTQKLGLLRHASDEYIVCLERIASDFVRYSTRGRKTSSLDKLRSVACSYVALKLGLSIQRVWATYKSNLSEDQIQQYLNNPSLELACVSNQPKMFHFTQKDDYDHIEELWSDDSDAKQIRAMFGLQGRSVAITKPTRAEFMDLIERKESRMIKRAKRTTRNT